ncbi:MAG: porin family protein, partial [Gemmatimonadetes bacterium]|nr:porin family protein [Gemmatimonadota bacterium]
MRSRLFATVLSLAIAMPLAAQEPFTPIEIGAYGQYTKFADVTRLDPAFGLGGLVSIPVFKRIAFQYEGDFGSTNSTRVGDLTAWNHRFDLVYHIPWGARRTVFLGGGWTGSQYKTDTTKNQYDSGGNLQAGVRFCMSDNWALRTSAVMDFKDPSDQIPTGDRTQTLGLRAGISRFFGGAGSSPCVVVVPPPPPPPPAPAPPPPP